MPKVWVLFAISGLLVFAFGLFVPAEGALTSFNFWGITLVGNSARVIMGVGAVGLLFALLYRYTDTFLYSKNWALLHWIAYIFLFLNIWSWGFVERIYLGEGDAILQVDKLSAENSDRFTRIEGIYHGALTILLLMQLVYFLNLLVGILYRKSKFGE